MKRRLKLKQFIIFLLLLVIIGCGGGTKTAVINSFKSNVAEVAFKQEVTLTWDVTDGDTCSIASTSETGEQKQVDNLACSEGQRNFTLESTTAFRLIATPGSVQKDLTVSVDYLSPEKTSLSFSALAGNSPANQTLSLTNNANSERSFAVENTLSGLTVIPSFGLIPARESVILTVSTKACSAAETESGELTIKSPNDAAVSTKSEDVITVRRECSQKLIANDGAADDQFGISVAISGDTAIIGARFDNNDKGTDAGAAYIYERDNSDAWVQQHKLLASDGLASDIFGTSVAISGNTIVVGARQANIGTNGNQGAAYIFERDRGGPNNWGEVKKLIAENGLADDVFGNTVAISGDTAIIGARFDDEKGTNAGAAYIFERNQGGTNNWGLVKKLTASDGAEGDNFSFSIAISEDRAIISAGSPDDPPVTGAAYIFERDQGGNDNWGQVQKLTASDGAPDDNFGVSVALSGDTAIVGARYNDNDKGVRAGAAYIYERNSSGVWVPAGPQLTASDGEAGDLFGLPVVISGDTVIVGTRGDDSSSGSAYAFERNSSGIWIQQEPKLIANDGEAGDDFGVSAALSEDTVIVGARIGDSDTIENAGSAYIFSR